MKTEKHAIGPHTVQVRFQDEPARDCPMSGNNWAEEQDYPGVCVTIMIPGRPGRPDQICAELESRKLVFGEVLGSYWGYLETDGDGTFRVRSMVFRASSRSECVKAAQNCAAEALATIREVVGARLTRLAQRDRTIALWDDTVAP